MACIIIATNAKSESPKATQNATLEINRVNMWYKESQWVVSMIGRVKWKRGRCTTHASNGNSFILIHAASHAKEVTFATLDWIYYVIQIVA